MAIRLCNAAWLRDLVHIAEGLQQSLRQFTTAHPQVRTAPILDVCLFYADAIRKQEGKATNLKRYNMAALSSATLKLELPGVAFITGGAR